MALAIIMSLYVSIGALAAVGSMYLTHRSVPARFEAAVYGVFLIPIAAFYLAFASHFGDEAAWNLETVAVVGFAVLGCLGTRLPVVLVVGYVLHGAWDVLHEIHAHVGSDVFLGRQSTQIPLAYGAFCATYDWAMAVYFLYRRGAWVAAWASRVRQ
ncbi:DUF6010 family protein [Immundisolibacter sp.]